MEKVKTHIDKLSKVDNTFTLPAISVSLLINRKKIKNDGRVRDADKYEEIKKKKNAGIIKVL